MRSLLLISTITAASAQAVFTDPAVLKAAVRDPSCCVNGEYEYDDNGDVISTIRQPSYDNSCTYNGVEIKDWDVSQITDFSSLFLSNWGGNSNDCLWKFNADISSWVVSEGLNFELMFTNAQAFNADISKWNVSKGTNFQQMFSNAQAFNADISKWVVSNGLNFYGMFNFALSFNQDISGWRPTPNLPANVFSEMFHNAISFNQNLDDWNMKVSPAVGTTNSYTLIDMFAFTYSLNHLPTWFSENEGYRSTDAKSSCALDDTCGTCKQPRKQDFYLGFGQLFPEVMPTVTCNAGQLNPFDGVDCKAQGCVDDNTLCCNPACHTHESATECLAGASVCWWNLDTKKCTNSCTLDWKNDKLRQCSDIACGPGTELIDGKCKPACTSDGCVELKEAYKTQCD